MPNFFQRNTFFQNPKKYRLKYPDVIYIDVNENACRGGWKLSRYKIDFIIAIECHHEYVENTFVDAFVDALRLQFVASSFCLIFSSH